MNSGTHTQMQSLVQRASAPGSLGLRSTYYSNDGSNDPPPSPTAQWKASTHAHVDPSKDPSRYPYLPHPYPVLRRGRSHSGHPGGFKSLQEPLQPVKFPEEEQIYMTYSEWWHAQRPKGPPVNDKDGTFSTSYWPYGRRISAVSTMDKEHQYYHLDKRLLRNATHYKERRDPMSSTGNLSRSRSSGDLLGSHTEHFDKFNRSMGIKRSSHASAGFHEERKRAPDMAKDPSKRTAWDSCPPAAMPAGTAAGQRATSAPSTSRSVEAQAGSSQYKPRQEHWNLGLGSRTHAEWCLPQPRSGLGY